MTNQMGIEKGITIVCGLPGTGKTTFAKALSDAIGAVHLNTDRIRHAMGRQGQYSDTLKTTIYESLLRRTREALYEGKHVVIDGTFYKQKFRKAYIRLAKDLVVPLHWIEIVAAEETVRERVSHSRPYTEADFSVYQKVKAEFEPLTDPRLVLDSDILSIDEMVFTAKKYMTAHRAST